MLILISSGEISDDVQFATVDRVTDDKMHQKMELRFAAEAYAKATRTPIAEVVINPLGAPIDIPE